MTDCKNCGGTVIEYDAAAGNGFCIGCGTVVEENIIVSEVTFGESSSGAAMVQGSYVGQGSTHARMGGPFGNRGSSESREQTIANASRKIRNVAAALRLSEMVQAAAVRMYTLAVEHKFTKGRKNMNVIAVCLYVACRQKETRNYMLIDFSDLLQVNVFELGHTYLQLVHTLNLRLPLVDPSHYISRFAALLEFGDETSRVAADAVRLVARMDRDWMSRGRRPAGICGACLLLAARMNNFRRSVQEIVQVVKIADTTLKKRLDEFKKTPSGQLTLADFRTVWLEDEMDPPAYTKGREREMKEEEDDDDADGEGNVEQEANGRRKKKKKKRKKRKLNEVEDGEDEDTVVANAAATVPEEELSSRPAIDPQLLNEGILAGTTDVPLFLPASDGEDETNGNIDPALVAEGSSQTPPIAEDLESSNPMDEAVDAVLTEEVAQFLEGSQGARLASALDEAEERRRSGLSTDDELLGLDEAELDAFIMTEEEVRMKERVWVEINKDYLEALAAKEALKAGTEQPKSRKQKRKTSSKPRDASTPSGSTPGESVRNLIKKNPKYSKRINYDALNDLFDGAGGAMEGSSLLDPGRDIDLDEKEDALYHLSENEKSDGESMLVIEESGGGVGMVQNSANARNKSNEKYSRPESESEGAVPGDDTVVMDDDAEVELSDKGEDYGWEDVYEQEV